MRNPKSKTSTKYNNVSRCAIAATKIRKKYETSKLALRLNGGPARRVPGPCVKGRGRQSP